MFYTAAPDPSEITAKDRGAVEAIAQTVIRRFEAQGDWNPADDECAEALAKALSQAVARLRHEGHPRAGAFKRAAEHFIADSLNVEYWSF